MTRTTSRTRRFVAAAIAASAIVAGTAVASTGLAAPGTPGKDVHFGGDEDNAENEFIQPPGVTAKQHMDNTDLLFGRENKDLLVGVLGDDTLLGGEASDILIGGPEKASSPNSDVLVGEEGKDINIWAPGDGSDAYAGNEGKDTMIFAPFVEKSNGDLLLTRSNGRKIPHVDIDDQDAFSCTIVKVPPAKKLGFQFLIRFNVNGNPVVTVRQKDVEKVFCPSPNPGKAAFANLKAKHPVFHDVRLRNVRGTVGAIMAPVA